MTALNVNDRVKVVNDDKGAIDFFKVGDIGTVIKAYRAAGFDYVGVRFDNGHVEPTGWDVQRFEKISEFAIGDRVIYVGKANINEQRRMGAVGTVVELGNGWAAEDGLFVLWDENNLRSAASDGRVWHYTANVQKVDDLADWEKDLYGLLEESEDDSDYYDDDDDDFEDSDLDDDDPFADPFADLEEDVQTSPEAEILRQVATEFLTLASAHEAAAEAALTFADALDRITNLSK